MKTNTKKTTPDRAADEADATICTAYYAAKAVYDAARVDYCAAKVTKATYYAARDAYCAAKDAKDAYDTNAAYAAAGVAYEAAIASAANRNPPNHSDADSGL